MLRQLNRAGVVLLCGALLSGVAGPPQVQRVEPPTWWVNHSWNPVRLLVTGTNLAQIDTVTATGLVISNVTPTATGNYLFCDVFIPAALAPGERTLQLDGPTGQASVGFQLAAPLARTNRFAGFSPDDVIYLLMPDRFANGDATNDDPSVSRGLLNRTKPRDYHGGDFQGVLNRLDYLQDLGVTALWLTPWYDNANHPNTKEKYTADNQRSPRGVASTDYHGYGAVDFYGVEERFGDLPKLQELATTAQARGFKIIQDQVANHTGPYHPWVRRPPTPSWFNGTLEQHLDNNWQIWTVAAPNAPADQRRATLEGWFINILPDLNQNDPETARYLIQNSLWWIGSTGLDAVRQDTLPYVPRSYWAQWTRALKQEYPQLTILGELWDGKPELVAFFQGGRKQFDGVDTGVDTLFDFPLYYALRDVFAKRQPVQRLAEVLAADRHYVNPQVLVTFLGLHDTPRFMNEPGATSEGLKLAFTYLLTTRGTPLIYYGDEIALPGGGDPDNRRDFPGGWPEDERNAFTSAGRTATEGEVHAHVRKLTALRRDLAPLRRGDYRELLVREHTYVFARTIPAASTVVALNNSAHSQSVEVNLAALPGGNPRAWKNYLSGTTETLQSGLTRIDLPPFAAAILAPKSERVVSGD